MADFDLLAPDTPAQPRARTVFSEIIASTLSSRNLSAFARLDSFRRRAPGWDGYQGKAASEEAITQAKAFLASLPTDILAPELELSGDGEVNLVWRSEVAYLEIGFTGDTMFSFFGKSLAEPLIREFGDVPSAANRLPMKLHALMGKFVDAVPVRSRVAEPAPVAWAC